MGGTTTRQGFTFGTRTVAMLDELSDLFGPYRIVQGSYSDGGQSAGTHTGDGAVDVSDNGMDRATRDRFVKEARRIGWAMWWRPDLPGKWDSHFHGIAIQKGGKNDRGALAVSAHNQVIDYYEGRDGLAGDGPDPHRGLGIKPITFEQYLADRDDDMPLTDAEISKIGANVEKRLAPSFSTLNKNVWTAIGAARSAKDAADDNPGEIATWLTGWLGDDLARKVVDEMNRRLTP